ncbi:hypothetical protein SUDANB95_07886 (plasmid) [Actinosynnema sp. ALI-1.44]
MTDINLYDQQESDEINAAQMMAEAAALRVATVSLAIAARIVRRVFPEAVAVEVHTGTWYDRTDSTGVQLQAIYDADHQTLWSAAQEQEPQVPGTDGGWTEVAATIEFRLGAALPHATPKQCGWKAIDRSDPDVHRIVLPVVKDVQPALTVATA